MSETIQHSQRPYLFFDAFIPQNSRLVRTLWNRASDSAQSLTFFTRHFATPLYAFSASFISLTEALTYIPSLAIGDAFSSLCLAIIGVITAVSSFFIPSIIFPPSQHLTHQIKEQNHPPKRQKKDATIAKKTKLKNLALNGSSAHVARLLRKFRFSPETLADAAKNALERTSHDKVPIIRSLIKAGAPVEKFSRFLPGVEQTLRALESETGESLVQQAYSFHILIATKKIMSQNAPGYIRRISDNMRCEGPLKTDIIKALEAIC